MNGTRCSWDGVIKMNELPELMTVKEIRVYLGCSNAKAYELVKRKDFPSFRIGNSYKIRKNDFVDWVNKQKSR